MKDSNRSARLGGARLVAVAVASLAVLALQPGVASAGRSNSIEVSGPTAEASRQNFLRDAKKFCANYGGLKGYKIYTTGPGPVAGTWSTAGTYECNK